MSYHEIRFSQHCLREIVRRFLSSGTSHLVCTVGCINHGDRRRWLVHSLQPPAPSTPRVLVVGEEDPNGIERTILRGMGYSHWNDETLVLVLGLGPAQGWIAAAWCFQGRVVPVQQFVLVGPGWLRLPKSGSDVSAAAAGGIPLQHLFSRTIGALGQGTFTALRQLTVAVVGCGRLGSLVAELLASTGVARLILVDADRLELHNFGEMAAVEVEDLGKPKVAALTRGIRRGAVARGTDIHTVIEPVDSLMALFAVKTADILVTCADSAAARLAAAVLAASYLQPLLDLGTGILPDCPGQRMGADVRLVLPGRCLLCWGGLASLPAAAAFLLAGRPDPPPDDFHQQRLGSLRSLNELAASLGITLLEQFLAGRLGESAWLQVDLTAAGVPQLNHRVPRTVPTCLVCTLAGRGDAALQDLPSILRQMTGSSSAE